MMIDYHVHTKTSPDGKGEMQDYLKIAGEKGIDEIGFSDHLDPEQLGHESVFLNRTMPNHVRDFLDLKERASIPIRLGIEVGFSTDAIEEMREILKQYPFDYVIGSVHMLGNWIFDDPRQIDEHSRKNPLAAYEEYFQAVRSMCSYRLFDILGHPDLIKIFGLKPCEDITEIYEKTAKAIARSGICAEINPKGLDRICKEIYPNEQFLKILHDFDVPITFGSDAHEPRDLGHNLHQAVKLAERVGYTKFCIFENRKRESVEI